MSSTKKLVPKKRGGNLDNLTHKQRIFVEALMCDKNFSLTNAATKAGYSSPTKAGTRLLNNPNIQAILGKKLYLRGQESEIDASKVLQELALVGFSNIRNLEGFLQCKQTLSDLPETVTAAIRTVKIKKRSYYDAELDQMVEEERREITLWDKPKGLELIAKHLGMLDERIKHGFDEDDEVIKGLNKLVNIMANGSTQVVDDDYLEGYVVESNNEDLVVTPALIEEA